MHRTADPMHQPRMVRPPRGGGGTPVLYATNGRGNDFSGVWAGHFGIAGGQLQPTSVPTATAPDDTPGTTPAGLGAIQLVNSNGELVNPGWHWAWPELGVAMHRHGLWQILGTISLPVDGMPDETATVYRLGLPRMAFG